MEIQNDLEFFINFNERERRKSELGESFPTPLTRVVPSLNESERDFLPPRVKARSDSLTVFFRSIKDRNAGLQNSRNADVEPEVSAERLPCKHVIETKETAAAAATTLSPSSTIFAQNKMSQSEIADKESDNDSERKSVVEIRAADTCIDSNNDAISINLD